MLQQSGHSNKRSTTCNTQIRILAAKNCEIRLVNNLPQNVMGRDILHQLGIHLTASKLNAKTIDLSTLFTRLGWSNFIRLNLPSKKNSVLHNIKVEGYNYTYWNEKEKTRKTNRRQRNIQIGKMLRRILHKPSGYNCKERQKCQNSFRFKRTKHCYARKKIRNAKYRSSHRRSSKIYLRKY